MIYIIDTYAWIEYLNGSSKGKILRKLFESAEDKFITMECCLSELAGYSLKTNQDFESMLEIVKINSIILPVLAKNWLEAARIKDELRKNRPHFGLIDAILVSKRKELKCKLISGDDHFKNLKDVVYIGD